MFVLPGSTFAMEGVDGGFVCCGPAGGILAAGVALAATSGIWEESGPKFGAGRKARGGSNTKAK